MKTITVKTMQGLKEALQSEEKNLQIKFINKKIVSFPKMNVERTAGVVILELYTPKLKTLKNVPVASTFMNWLDVEEASLTKIETASECNITNPCVCYLPCLKDDDVVVTKESIEHSGFIRLVFAWQQFTKGYMHAIFDQEKGLTPRACIPGMVCSDYSKLKVIDVFKDIVKQEAMLTTIEILMARKVLETNIGELTFSTI